MAYLLSGGGLKPPPAIIKLYINQNKPSWAANPGRK
jgi:hypothetical protein